jgi:hypothetical protein
MDGSDFMSGRSRFATKANSTQVEKRLHSAPLTPRVGGASCAAPEGGGFRVGDENERAALINEISRVIRDPSMPETTRTAGLTLIGWLARRLPGELPHAIGIPEARESERRIKAARQKLR